MTTLEKVANAIAFADGWREPFDMHPLQRAVYDKRASAAIEVTDNAEPDVAPAVAFSRWIMAGPKLAAAAGCYVGIKVTAAKGGDK